MTFPPKKNKALVFGLIGGGIAVAIAMIVIVVFFVMSLPTTIPTPTTSPQVTNNTTTTTTPPPLQQQPMNNNKNSGDDALFTTPEERLRQEDPAFDNFMTRVDGCFNYIPGFTDPGPNDPSPSMCQQIMQTAFNSWYGACENFHAEKCEHVTGAMEAYELATIRKRKRQRKRK